MSTIVRHAISILLLPMTVVVIVPFLLLRTGGAPAGGGGGATLDVVSRVAGGVLFGAGFALFAWCVSLFAHVGQGTLAPWDPTRRLVAVGPYRHVRNPMISGVATMLLGEILFWRSGRLALWACAFVLINHTYFLLSEEPGLQRRFGDSYLAYRAHVPRWIPRLRPWRD